MSNKIKKYIFLPDNVQQNLQCLSLSLSPFPSLSPSLSFSLSLPFPLFPPLSLFLSFSPFLPLLTFVACLWEMGLIKGSK